MSWLSPRAVRRRRLSTFRYARPNLIELESRVNPTNVLQYHMDALSNGVNSTETTLTRSNVNQNTFGKLYQIQVTGQVYAEPLVETGINITVGANQGMHDVVFVATQHDQLYAYDANAATPTLLWQRSFLSDAKNTNSGDLLAGNTGVTTVPQSAIISTDVTVEIGITGTPVIDPSTGTIYLVAKTAETVAGTVHYVQRLYAVNVQTGADKTAPFLLGDTTGTSTYVNYASQAHNSTTAASQIFVYGSGNGTNDRVTDPYNGTGLTVVQFNALREAQRPALNLANGVVYIGWASHGDNGPYHGWMVGVSAYTAAAPTLTLKGVLNTTPNGGLGGIWQAGGALTFDGTYFYFETGNGTFDGGNGTGTGSNPAAPAPGPVSGLNNAGFPIKGDYGDSFVKVALDPTTTATNQNRTTNSATETANSNGWGLKIVDYFTPFNQNYLNATDKDVGSSAAVVVPDYNTVVGGTNQFASAGTPRLLVGSGKEGVIYLMNRDNMGKYGLTNNIVQNSANELSGSLDSAALFNGKMYYVEGYGGVAKSFDFANAAFAAPATTRSTDPFSFAGSTPFISSNGLTNGIVWDVDRGLNELRAYSTDSYATELWTSGQAANARDTLGAAVKFQVPTVANGRVYVAAGTGDPNNFLDIYGLITTPFAAPAAPSNLAAQPVSSSQVNLTWTDNAVFPNSSFGYYIEQSPNGTSNWTQVAQSGGVAFSVGGLSANTTYYFRVRAFNSAGISGYSGVVGVTTTSQGNTINYPAPNGFTGFPGNGALTFVGGASVVSNTPPTNSYVSLTDGNTNETRAAYATTPQTISAFTTTFTYLMTGAQDGTADGMTFVIQTDPRGLAAIGEGGGLLGYGATATPANAIHPSFALAFNVNVSHPYGTEFLTNGTVDFNYTQSSINTSLVNVPITVTINYFGGNTLSATLTQGSNSQTKTYTFASNLATLLGSSTAYVGFTAATGAKISTQKITSWTFSQLSPPDAPTNLQAQLTGYTPASNPAFPPPPLGTHLTWTAAAGAVSYKIERKLTAGGAYTQVGTSTTTSFDDTALTPASTYFYRVRATNAVGDGVYSAELQVITPSLAPTATNSQVNGVTQTSISFQWQDNANNEDGYQIIRQTGGAGGFVLIATLPANTTPAPSTMTFTDTGLTAGTAYDYHILAFNLAGYSDFAGVSTSTASTAPANLVATTGNASIGLTWSAVIGASTYSVYRGASPGAEDTTPIATGVTTTAYTDSSPMSFGKTYYYKVTSTTAGVEGLPSNEASALAFGPTSVTLQANPNPATSTQTVTLAANATSVGGAPHAGTVQFFDDGTLFATVSLNNLGFAAYQSTFPVGTHHFTASYGGTVGFAASSTTQSTDVVINGPPIVVGIQVNDGSGQRSELRSMSVTFSGPVTFSGGNAASAFQLLHVQTGNLVGLSALTSLDGLGRTVVVLTFSGAETDPISGQNGNSAMPSLSDGRYRLTILGANVTGANGQALDGAGTGTAGSNYVSPTDVLGGGAGQLHLYRIFGDTNGDGIVDQQDLGQFRATFNAGVNDPPYLAYLDANNDLTIDQQDLGQFRARLNANVF